MLYLLSSSNVNTPVFSGNYYGLLWLTGLLAAGLVGLLGFQLWNLRNKLKNKVFGAKLTQRLLLLFTLIGVLPSILIYAVSVQFLDKSIESWFDVRVEKALEGGLNLGRSGLNSSLSELAKKAQFAALLLADKHPEQHQEVLKQLVDEKVVQEAAIFTLKGNLVSFSSASRAIPPDMPSGEMLKMTTDQGSYSVIDMPPDEAMLFRSLVSFELSASPAGRYVLQFTQAVPVQIMKDVETVQMVYRDYQELTLSRQGLKRIYAITLTLSLLVVLLTAVSAAFFISNRLGSSLEALAEGTRAVAQGDFSVRQPIRSSDELGALTGLFNQMTMQLSEARSISEQQQQQVERAKGYLESVLTHLSSGVLGFDGRFQLRSANTSASQILGSPLHEMLRMSLDQMTARSALLVSFCNTIKEAFDETSQGDWQRQIERLSKNGNQILLIRGTRLPDISGAGYVVVFDDISHLMQAERQAAWGEVARRLAHEIKNPLMPIQLSAERLEYKLSGKLDEGSAQLLKRATQTIVSQVSAMKNMVGDFANYARGPALKLSNLELHQLIREVLGLYEADAIHIELNLNATREQVSGDATRLRQVIHNLLLNAQDAVTGSAQPKIVLTTETLQEEIRLIVEDNGDGFSENALTRVFEPYMTTKSKGTGLGLAIVKKIVEEHGGHIGVKNILGGGARVSVTLPLIKEA
ncbi:MAG: ATP-binding protein [Gallionella sp.]